MFSPILSQIRHSFFIVLSGNKTLRQRISVQEKCLPVAACQMVLSFSLKQSIISSSYNCAGACAMNGSSVPNTDCHH